MTPATPTKGQDPKPQDLPPINATFRRKTLTCLACWASCRRALRPFLPPSMRQDGGMLFLPGLCIKTRRHGSLAEAHTMQFVARHTSIPVPAVYCAFTRRDRSFIVMERMKGRMVCVDWYRRAPDSKQRILDQLTTMIRQLREIPPTGQAVCGCIGGPIFDVRLPKRPGMWHGPFDSIDAFHDYLRSGYDAKLLSTQEDTKEMYELQASQGGPVVFTHGDLSSFNIMVHDDEVTGIIDWETAGWYPGYWEYTSAWHVSPLNEFWRAEVPKFVTPWDRELRMETIRRRWFGDF